MTLTKARTTLFVFLTLANNWGREIEFRRDLDVTNLLIGGKQRD